MLLAIASVAALLVVSVTHLLFETDFWQHLLVGRHIWETRSVPDRQIWSWPTYGAPEVTHSWLFRALVWPLWSAAGVWGLFAWRWLTTLAAFGLAWATARRMGVRGFAALAALGLCILAYRARSQIRPETLVVVLLALEIWLLEIRRRGGSDRSPWLIAIAWVWANAHVSYYLGFVLLGAYLADDALAAWRGDRAARSRLPRLAWVGLAAAAVSFANPFGWVGLWQPFEYLVHLRHEPLYRTVDELKPFAWREVLANGFFLPLLGWPLLILWRARRRGTDLAEILICLAFTAMALSSRRFFGFYAVAAAPFLMRDLDAWTRDRRWPVRPTSPWPRAAAVAALSLLAIVREIQRPDPPVGVAIDMRRFPVRACDFIAEHGLRGRIFNHFYDGGYLLYRFWPDPDRLPFMDIHLSGGPEIRRRYLEALDRADGWRALDRRYRPDLALLDLTWNAGRPVLDALDADTLWALVFVDDAAALYARRDGSAAEVAARFAYRRLPVGRVGLARVGEASARDTALRAEVAAELERVVAGSPWHGGAQSLLANIALSEGRYDDARRRLERAAQVAIRVNRLHERLGRIALEQGRPREALRHLARERTLEPRRPGIALLTGRAWRALGDIGRAESWYRRELRLDPGSQEARDSLRALGRGPGE